MRTYGSGKNIWQKYRKSWRFPGTGHVHRPQTYAADACGITLPAEKVAALKRCGRSTLYMTLLTAFAVQMHRYSGQDDIVVGSPIANRQDERLEGLIGFFANMLVMRARVNSNASFSELLEQVRDMALETYRHQHIAFERLVELCRYAAA